LNRRHESVILKESTTEGSRLRLATAQRRLTFELPRADNGIGI
jgi:hypothetical protein